MRWVYFFAQSNTKALYVSSSEDPHIIANDINDFLVNYGYIAHCSFGKGRFSDSPYIIFVRSDMPFIRVSNGVYCRICFHRKNDFLHKIEVSVNQSYLNEYNFLAKDKVKQYIDSSADFSFFSYPNCDTNAIIDKLEMDLSYFLRFPVKELESIQQTITVKLVNKIFTINLLPYSHKENYMQYLSSVISHTGKNFAKSSQRNYLEKLEQFIYNELEPLGIAEKFDIYKVDSIEMLEHLLQTMGDKQNLLYKISRNNHRKPYCDKNIADYLGGDPYYSLKYYIKFLKERLR